MSCAHKRFAAALWLTAVGAAIAILAPSASAGSAASCPSGGTPAPGSTITGGLEVDGLCQLTDVTITGGITVDATSASLLSSGVQNAAVLNGATVNGSVVVGSGSAVFAGVDLSNGNLTHDPSTIDGRVTLNASGFALADTTVRGGLTKNGAFDWPSICDGDPSCFGFNFLCDSEVFGDVTVRDVNTEKVFLGDPREHQFANGDCVGNTIHGSVFLDNTNFVSFDGEPSEIEGETITGTVHLDHSTAEVNENTIGGSLLCTSGTVIFPPMGPDVGGNAVRGQDTCD